MSRRVIGYELISSDALHGFNLYCQKMINAGWEPHGTIIIEFKSYTNQYYQVFIKYEDENISSNFSKSARAVKV